VRLVARILIDELARGKDHEEPRWGKMKVKRFIVYAKDRYASGKVLKDMVAKFGPKGKVDAYDSVSGLTERLRTPQREPTLAVLHVSDQDDFKSILTIQSLFGDIPIILILPDREPDTITKGHSMHPRYLGFKDNGFTDVQAVLARMMKTRTVRGQARLKPGWI